jgi:hypothetical protein
LVVLLVVISVCFTSEILKQTRNISSSLISGVSPKYNGA